jgi:hypothetical protein
MKRQRGSQSLEFAMIALPFVLLLLAIFELTRFLWLNMVFDSAVNQAMRVARVIPLAYATDQSIKEKIASYPLLEEEKVELSAPRYAGSVSDLAQYRASYSSQAKLGQYTVKYHFSFLLVPKLSAAWQKSMTLQRVMVVAYDH